MRVHGAVRFARGHAADDVADRDAAGALLSRLAQRRERICRLTGLRDDDRQLVSADDRIAVAVLRSIVDLDADLGQRLDQILSDQCRMPRGAARQQRDLVDRAQRGVRNIEVLEEDSPRIERHAPEDGVAAGRGLLVDLLEHEVLVAALLRRDRIPEHALRRLRDFTPRIVGELHAGAGDHRHLLVGEEDDVACVAQNRRNIGSNEKLLISQPDDDRRTVANGDNLLRIVRGHEHDREHAAHRHQGAPHGVLEAVVLHFALDEVRDDLGVGLGRELVTLRLQFPLQVEVVLDDAVVHDDNAAGAVAMRMGVLLGGTAVCRPARMADSVEAVERLFADGAFQVGQLPRRPSQRNAVSTDQRDAGGVVTAILHTPQAVQKDGYDRLRPDVSDDAAHM